MATWEQQVQALKDKHKGNPWSPYAPQSKRGFDIVAQNENLACVLCESFVGVKSEEVIQPDGSIIIVCDHDLTPGRDKRVTLIPNVSDEGGATITSTSAHECSRRLIKSR